MREEFCASLLSVYSFHITCSHMIHYEYKNIDDHSFKTNCMYAVCTVLKSLVYLNHQAQF